MLKDDFTWMLQRMFYQTTFSYTFAANSSDL